MYGPSTAKTVRGMTISVCTHVVITIATYNSWSENLLKQKKIDEGAHFIKPFKTLKSICEFICEEQSGRVDKGS